MCAVPLRPPELRRFLFIACLILLPTLAFPAPAAAWVPRIQAASSQEARETLSKGVQAYLNGRIEQAIEFFKLAKELDSSLLEATLYLGVAHASLYMPGVETEENRRIGEQAIEEFRKVLDKDPQNLLAIDGIANLLYRMGADSSDPRKLEESKGYHRKHIELRPEDPEPYLGIGVIDWAPAFRANQKMRNVYSSAASEPLRPDDPLPPNLRVEFVGKFGAIVDEGIEHLNKAIDLRPDYIDAMAYLNLLYRLKADQVFTDAERNRYFQIADDLVERIKEIRIKKSEKEKETRQP